MYPTMVFCAALLISICWIVYMVDRMVRRRNTHFGTYVLLFIAVFLWGLLYYLSH